MTFSYKISRFLPHPYSGTFVAAILLLGAALPCAAQQKSELTLAEFRALVHEQSPQANQEKADGIFYRLLQAQGEKDATRQSHDRLSGWHKAVQARFQAQNAPALDVDMLRLSEARAAAAVAQFEADRLTAVREANLLLKRPAGSTVTALIETSTKDKKEEPAASSPAAQDVSPDIASRKAQFEKELLPAGNELLSKMYQSYLFGGVPLAALLWEEQEVYKTELQYRLLLVETQRRPPAAQ